MKIKWNLYWAAALFAGYLLVSDGVPLLPVLAGVGITAGVIVPFIAGWGLLAAWGAPTPEAIFVGASMVATSVGITASVLSARGLLNETASKIILAAAVIDDVLGLIVLAVVSSISRGHINV